jgi:DNA-binding transcriptional regulator YhcF (GntR family)
MKQNTASQRIVAELRARIRSGAIAPGECVPSARQIVRDFGVALATASKVLAQLRREGLVVVKPGIGTVVRKERGPDLTRQLIIEAAIAIADDEGTVRLTMRALAKELGVATMSLYRHVASREELLLLMADAVLAEAELPRRTPNKWRSELERIARLQFASYRRHPWLAQLLSMTRPQLLKNGIRHTEFVLSAIAALDLGSAATLRSGVMLLAFIRGMGVSLEAELQAEQDSGLTNDEWMSTQLPTFMPLFPQLPTLARLASERDIDMSLEALFECGLTAILDGLQAQAKTRERR